jgi:hypothetical protein
VVVQDCAEDSDEEMTTLPKHGWNIWAMENRNGMEPEGLARDAGQHEM